MLDPASIATAVSLSTVAFNNLKKAFAVGRDIESMGNDLSRWMKASSDIDQAVKSTKNPPFYKKFLSGDSVEQAAVKSLIAQKNIESQRYDLQQYIKLRFGVKAWNDLLKMEGQIRKHRQEQIYKRQQLKQTIMEAFFMLFLVLTIFGFIVFIFWLKRQRDGN
jgi:cell division protein FtsL